MDAADSRARVVDLIELLREHRPEAFLTHHDTEFADVKVIIIGEPA